MESVTLLISVDGDMMLEHGTSKYLIQNIDHNTQCDCSLKCDDCDACINQYSCTCIDYLVKWNMCKHIHFMIRKLK